MKEVDVQSRTLMPPRRLCFGGSFNPIHNGHLACAAAVAGEIGFEQVVLIPSSQPPHKQQLTDIAPAADRLGMCRLAATAGGPLWSVNDIEMNRSGPSYTLDTARALRSAGWADITWLIGADMARYLPHWHQPQQLLAEVHFLLIARPGWSFDWDTMPPEYRFLQSRVVQAPLIDISSTDIRRRVRAGEPITGLVPPVVEAYIANRLLYGPP